MSSFTSPVLGISKVLSAVLGTGGIHYVSTQHFLCGLLNVHAPLWKMQKVRSKIQEQVSPWALESYQAATPTNFVILGKLPGLGFAHL